MIETHSIGKLRKLVPDIDYMFEKFKYFFEELNGFVAGGFPRRLINNGSAKETLEAGDPGAFRNHADIDFYVRTHADIAKADDYFEAFPQARRFQESFGGNAKDFWITFVDLDLKYKCQLIKTFFGDPDIVIDHFDLANCQVAFDKEHFYCSDDWFELNKAKKLSIVDPNAKYLLSRATKYTKDNPEWSFTEASKPILLKRMVADLLKREKYEREHKVDSWNWLKGADAKPGTKEPLFVQHHIKNLLMMPGAVEITDIMLFFSKLGCWNSFEYDDEDNRHAIQKDMAVRIYEERLEREKNEKTTTD